MKAKTRNRLVLYTILSLLVIGVLAEIVLWYYGGPLLKKSLQKIIDKSTDYQYKIGFSKLRVNFFTRSLFIEEFKLIPDTTKETNKNLYYFTFQEFNIKQVNLFKLLTEKKLRIKEVSLLEPVIKFYKFSTIRNTNHTPISYEIVKKDFLSGILNIFNGIYIQDIIISGGRLDFLKELKQQNFTAKNVSLLLHNFQIDKRSFFKKSLFADKILIQIDDYRILLKNAHQFYAKRLVISTTDHKLTLWDANLKPLRLSDTSTNIFFSTKKIALRGVDFVDMYLNQRVRAQGLETQHINLSIYIKKKQRQQKPGKKEILSLVQTLFNEINIDEINLDDINFRIYSGFRSNNPLVYLKRGSIKLYQIHIDSTTSDVKQAFEALAISFATIQAKIMQQSHLLNINHIVFDSKKQKVRIEKLDVIPIKVNKNKFLTNLHLRKIALQGFDIKRIIGLSFVDLDKVSIGSGHIKLTLFSNGEKEKKKFDLPKIRINNFRIDNQNFDVRIVKPDKQSYLTGTTSITGKHISFYNNFKLPDINLGITIKDFSYKSPQSLTNLTLKQALISTKKHQAIVKGLSVIPGENVDSLLRVEHKSSVVDLYVPKIIIDSIDTQKFIKHKVLALDAISFDNPEVKIFYYPEISAKEYKEEIRKEIRNKAVKDLVLSASQYSFDLYQRINEFNDSTYMRYKRIVLYLDSIQNLAMDIILKIHIPEKQINPTDTTARNIEELKSIAINSFRELVNYPQVADSVFLNTVKQLVIIKRQVERPGFKFNMLKEILLSNIKGIETKQVNLNKAKLSLIQKYPDKEIVLFNNLISLKFINFNLTDSTDCNKRILCSDYILADIEKYTISLPDSIHSIEFNKLSINTSDSSVRISDLYIHADTSKNVLFPSKYFISGYIPRIDLLNINFRKLSDSEILKINKINIEKSFVHIINNGQKDTLKKPKQRFNFPFKQVVINYINAPANYLHFFNKKDSTDIYTRTKFVVDDFRFDTVKQIIGTLPVKFFQYSFYDLKIRTKKGLNLNGQEITFNSKGDLWSNNLTIKTKDSIRIFYDSLFINNFYPMQIVKDRKIHFTWLFLTNPKLFLNSERKKTQGQTELKDIDIYKIIKPIVYSITIDSSYIKNIALNTKSQKINNIDVSVKDLLIDSSARIDTPNLFFAQNMIVIIKNFKRKISEFYSLKFDTLKINLQAHNLVIKDFHFYPNYDREEFVRHLTWRTTLTDFYTSSIEAKKIQWKDLIFNKKLKVNLVSLKRFNLYAYTDRNIPHDYSDIKPHIIDLVLKSPIPLDINNVILQQGNIIYEERAPKHPSVGHIEINNANIIASNIKSNLTPPQQIKVTFSGDLMEKGDLNVYAYFDPDTINYTFRMYGNLGSMMLTLFNPFLIYATDVEINSGWLEKAEFVINGKDSIATGVFKANYRDLHITVLKPNGELQPKKRRFLSMAANMIVRKENPKYGIIYRVGIIAYIHDRSFSDIKFWIKSLLSGIKSLILFENKKEIKQINRLKMKFSAKTNP